MNGRLACNVLVDGNNIIYRIYHAVSKNDPSPIGLVRDTLNILGGWLKKIPNRSKIFLFLDGKSIRRLALYPEYKFGRTNEPVFSDFSTILADGFEPKSNFDVLIHMFSLLGIDIFWHPSEEADDLVSSFIKKRSGPHFILSSDKDFYQLISDDVIQMRPQSGSNWFYDRDRLHEELHVQPENIRLYRALTGDKSDNIPGIPRLRRAVAADLSNFNTPDALFTSGANVGSLKERKSIVSMRDRIQLNYELLGFKDDVDIDNCMTKSNLDENLVVSIFDGLGIYVDISSYIGRPSKRIVTSDVFEIETV